MDGKTGSPPIDAGRSGFRGAVLPGFLPRLFEHSRGLLYFGASSLAVLMTSRLLLTWTYLDRLTPDGALFEVFGRGWRFDVVVICAIVAVPFIGDSALPSRWVASRRWHRARAAWFTLWLAFIVLNEAATPAFMGEFGVRPNRVYVEYLDTPGLVLATIWGAERVSLLIGVGLAGICSMWFWRRVRPTALPGLPFRLAGRLLWALPILAILVVGVRGGLDHRPLSASNAAFSTDPTINDLALNSTYSAVHALRQMIQEREVMSMYSAQPLDETVAAVRAGMQVPEREFLAGGGPSAHRLVPTAAHARKPNLVILLQESLGGEYLGSLGGRPVATELERWRSRSFWFQNLYATGTRSARGIEAVVTGFLPTRSRSVIKLANAQHDFFTIARALKSQGYRTEFIYGGDSSFDNMRRFFLNNGFDRVIDSNDLGPGAAFTTTWGVSDGDLYRHVHQAVSQHHADGQPFFTLVFSTSNHPPYDFPDGEIDLFDEPRQTPSNAARYADAAAGRYLKLASESPYWNTSVFLVVADHSSRTLGADLVPVSSFRIPGFIAGGPVTPRIVDRIVSQIDLIPTTLSLMGLDVALPATGLDQSREDLAGPGRAIMQFNDSAAYRTGDHVVVLTPDAPPRHFSVDRGRLVPAARDAGLEASAVAHAAFPVLAYRKGWYR